MATLTLIGEPLHDFEAALHEEAARELTQAVAVTAPRGCSARLLIAADREPPTFTSARARVEKLPLNSNALPMVWRAGVTARPLDGEFVHAPTPLAALRSRSEDDGSQTSVMVPHALGWLAPELLGNSARPYRAFVKRAIRHADIVLTPTHATADALIERYGDGFVVQVLPLAPLPSLLRPEVDADDLDLPERYIATTATLDEVGRLDWLFDALESDASLPPLVVITDMTPNEAAASDSSADDTSGSDGTDGSNTASKGASDSSKSGNGGGASPASELAQRIPEAVRDRVHLVHPRQLSDIGAVLSGATILAMPQQHIGAGYEVLAALAAGVPVVHSACAATAELALDAGLTANDALEFVTELGRVATDPGLHERLSVLAVDRSRGFSWQSTAAMLWETHANL